MRFSVGVFMVPFLSDFGDMACFGAEMEELIEMD
jgi:hypothetical protein